MTILWLLPVGLGNNGRRWICLSVEQLALPKPESILLIINHLLKHLGCVFKAKGTLTERGGEKGKKTTGGREGESQGFSVSTATHCIHLFSVYNISGVTQSQGFELSGT